MKERSIRFMIYDQYIRNTQYKIDRLFTEYDEIDMNMNILAINNNHMMLNEGYSPDDIYYGNIDYVVEATEEKKGIIGKIIDGIKKIIHAIVAKVKDLFSNKSKIDSKTPVEVPKGLLKRHDRLKKLGPVVLKGLAAVGAVGAIAASAKYAHGKFKKDGDKVVFVPTAEPEADNKQLPAVVKTGSTALATVHQDPNFTFADGKMPTPAPKGHYRPNFVRKDSPNLDYPPATRNGSSPQVVEPFKQSDLSTIDKCNEQLRLELDSSKKRADLQDTDKITVNAGKLIAFISDMTDELTKVEKHLNGLDYDKLATLNNVESFKDTLSRLSEYVSSLDEMISKFTSALNLHAQLGNNTAKTISQHKSMKAMKDQQDKTHKALDNATYRYLGMKGQLH